MTDKEREDLILSNLKLVPYLIKRNIVKGSDDMEDLISVGNLALVEAANRYDPDLGYKFNTFAGSYIVNMVKRYKREKTNIYHGIKMSRRYQNECYLYTKECIKRGINGDNELEVQNLIQELNLKEFKPLITASLDKSINEDSDAINLHSMLDIIADNNDNIAEVELSYDFLRFISDSNNLFTDKDRKVMEELVRGYLEGKEYNQKEVAEILGVSQSHVSRVIKKCKKYYLESN